MPNIGVLMPYKQKLITLRRLTLAQSWDFLSLKISLLGCNVARAFSRACIFDLSGAPWVRFFRKSIHARNSGYGVTYVRPPVRPYTLPGWRWEAGEPLGTGFFGQFSLAGNRVAALHLTTRVFLARNHISDEQRDKGRKVEEKRKRQKRRRNLRNLSDESLKTSRGRRIEYFNKELRKAERNGATVYNG